MGNVKLSRIISLPFTNEACAILVALQATDNIPLIISLHIRSM